MTTPDNFAAEPEHYLPQEVDEFNTICKHILRNELAAARKILDRRMRDGVAEQSKAADMIAEERDAWEKRAKALEADNAALLIENDSLRGFVGSVFNDYSEAWGTDIDGLRMQELGIAYGLLHKVAVTEEMHDSGDHCENCDGECDECYRFTTLTQSCVNDLRDAALLAGKEKKNV